MSEKQVIRPSSEEPALARYLHSRGAQRGMPTNGTFELTARCNFDCRMCYVHQKDAPELQKRELSADQWLTLASQARDMGMMFLLLTGGEPTLRADFPYLYTELVKMGLLISVNTNASLYDGALRELFNRYPPSRLNVTLYGGSEDTYRAVCRSASYEKVVKNLRSMKEDGLQVRLNVTLSRYNMADMEKIDAVSREIGLQAKVSTYLYPPVRLGQAIGQNEARYDPVTAGKLMAKWNALRDTEEMTLRRAERLRRRQDAEIGGTCSDTEQEGVRCRAGRCAFWITWDGRMLPCGTMDTDAAYPLRDGFAAAWEETKACTAAIRLPSACTSCPDRQNCAVCASICKCETGSFDGKPEYLCTMVRAAAEETQRYAEQIEKGKKA